MFRWISRILKSEDDKPVMLSFVLQRDECSRLLGEFGEKHLDDAQSLIIVWKDSQGKVWEQHTDSMSDQEISGFLLAASLKLGLDNGK